MSEGLSLSDRLMPRRAAASKAARLAAEQLDSSSEEEGGSRTFGEPSRATTRPVKITYGSKSRTKSSPRKGRLVDIPIAKHSSIEFKTEPPLNSPRGRDGSAVRQQLDSHVQRDSEDSELSSLTDTDAEDEVLPVTHSWSEAQSKRLSVPKPEPTSRYGHLSTSEASHSAGRTTRKRVLSQSPSFTRLNSPDDLDTLTPLSSPEPEVEFTSRSTVISLDGGDAGSPRGSSTAPAKPRTSTLEPSSTSSWRSSLSLTKSSSFIVDAINEGADKWSLDGLGTYVWVRVDRSGHIVRGDSYNDTDAIWWPAQVVNHAVPLRVSLFGDGPGRLSDGRSPSLSTLNPSWWNIRSMTTSRGLIRFNEATYRLSGRPTDLQSSPRKKHKSDLTARWKEAYNLMVQADGDENDGLPVILSAYVGYDGGSRQRRRSTGSPRIGKVPHNGAAFEDLETTSVEERPWRAPSANYAYELPGELVLAKEKKANTDYWPAQLLEFVKPQTPKEKPKYRVGFYDGTIKVLEEGMFFTTSDDGFRTCKLGRDRFNYELDDDRDDPFLVDGPFDEENEPLSRACSPAPTTPPPLAFAFDLTLAEQFEYTKPVLSAVVEGRYEPARDLHDAFMRGQASRRKVSNIVSLRGNLRHHEVEELGRLVRRWARRKEKRQALAAAEAPLAVTVPAIAEHISGTVQDPDTHQAGGTPLPSSPLDTGDIDHDAVSEAEQPPPSSLPTTDGGEYTQVLRSPPPRFSDEGADIQRAIAAAALCELSDASTRTPLPRPLLDTKVQTVETNAVSIIGAESAARSPEDRETTTRRPRTEFADLSDLDKLTYCTDILLREAVLQLLLWRSRTRTAPELQAPEEEWRLHNIALQQAEETYWVHDIIRMKQAAEGSMLPPSSHSNIVTASSSRSSLAGGTRSRPSRR
ncbi:hypothetical protein OBBRIDRAFT_885221 [Obba rivulosa]|uniref:Uncharacterized protein n=1 Tax=Obba rivulosa TaxID=1052685 RepID=A0A8E2J3G3_9APHY|nr:hypothetical protein OBBRIDRAFT_885221 [Obba rivulosa]